VGHAADGRANLRPTFGSRATFVQVALPALPFREWADLVFSTATFHWVSDHAALFANIFTALRAGGRLHAQCGGGRNLAEAHALAEKVMHAPPFRQYFEGWPGAWQFASAEDTRDRLTAAGFVDVVTGLEPAPTTLASESDYRVCHDRHLSPASVAAARGAPPSVHRRGHRARGSRGILRSLDYWRLNMQATRPSRARGHDR
jgi:trans-aconitate 2-methyltransferase